MTQGFQSRAAFVVTLDGRRFTLFKPIVYIARDGTVYVMPEGAQTDGASTPQAIWDVLPPFGQYWLAALLHDCAYQNTLQIEGKDSMLSIANLTKEQSDSLLKEAMESLGVHEADVETIYQGVHIGGFKAFRDDRK